MILVTQNIKNYNNIVFEDDTLKIISVAGAVSHIDSQEDYSKVFHEELELKLFYEGSSTLLIGKETVVTRPGDLVVINPYEFHSTINYGQEKGKYHLLMVGLDFFGNADDLPDLRRIFVGEKTSIQTLIRNDPRAGQLVADIIAELYEKKALYRQAVRGLMLTLFALLLRDYQGKLNTELPTDKNIRYYEAIYPAIRKIRTDYAEKVSVDELANMCRVSKYHFCRIFKTVTKMSVLQYQTEYRLRIADIFLEKSNKSISEIATLCGFEDLCYFSRCYKKHNGISPAKKRAILSK